MRLKMQLESQPQRHSGIDWHMLSKTCMCSLVVCIIAILYGSLSPVEASLQASVNDKVQHVCAYGITMAFGVLAFRQHTMSLYIGLLIMSAGIEIIQPYVGRHMSGLDLLANSVGLALGWLLSANLIWLLKSDVRWLKPNIN